MLYHLSHLLSIPFLNFLNIFIILANKHTIFCKQSTKKLDSVLFSGYNIKVYNGYYAVWHIVSVNNIMKIKAEVK